MDPIEGSTRPRTATAASVLAMLALAGVAAWPAAVAADQTTAVDLISGVAQEIDGADEVDLSGEALASGDFNGDGRRDVLLTAPVGERAYVVFGTADPFVDLAGLGRKGIVIEGVVDGEVAPQGWPDVAAGDVNGDGIDDIVLGAPENDAAEHIGRGGAFVIFGSASLADVDLSRPNPGGFRILGSSDSTDTGREVATSDVNGDGRDDVLLGDARNDVWVVFGKSDTNVVNLDRLGSGGYEIEIDLDLDPLLGYGLSGSADVNGDGRGEVLIGAPNQSTYSGEAYVVFGKTTTFEVDLDALGSAGYRIDAEEDADANLSISNLGSSIADVGDVNGDGRSDLVVGAPTGGAGAEGRGYVVFGRGETTTIDLDALGSRGFTIEGVLPYDSAGAAVAGAGDYDADGTPDVLVGAPYADGNGRENSGAAFVTRGKADTDAVDLGALGSRGVRLDGPTVDAVAGWAVGAAPGFRGPDDLANVMVGSPSTSPNGRIAAGATFLLPGALVPRAQIQQTLSEMSLSRDRFAVASATTIRAAAAAGTVIRYRVRRPVTVTIRLFRRVPGEATIRLPRRGQRRPRSAATARPGVGAEVRCRPRRGRVRQGRGCLRDVLAGTIRRRHRAAGIQTIRFSGRIGRRALRPGAYRLVATARDARGRTHGPAVVRFTIERRRTR